MIIKQNNIDLIDTNDKKVISKKELEKLLISYSINKLDDPFKSYSVKQVAKDLKIGKNKAYELFNQPDFPSINIGRTWKIMILPYLIWKINKKV